MNDDIERQLGSVTPLRPSPDLRSRVFSAMADEVNTVAPRRRLPPSLFVAAALLAGLMLNELASRAVDRRLAALLGPPPVHRQAAEIAADIAAITDPPTGRWAYDRLAPGRTADDEPRRYAARLRGYIQQFTFEPEAAADETPEEVPQVGRDLRGSRDRPRADAQCALRLEHRDTA